MMQGRKAYGSTDAERSIIVYIKRLRNKNHGVRRTFSQIATILNADHERYPPPRGKLWYATTIENIIERHKRVERAAGKRVKKLGLGGADYLSVRQAADLFVQCQGMLDVGTVRQKRAARIVLALMLTGIRRAELCDLRIKDTPAYHGKNEITVRGKGNTLGTVAISPWTRQFLDNLCKLGGQRRTGWLFRNEVGRKYNPQSINGIVSGVGCKANLPFLHPHILRHTYASILTWAGCDIAFVKNQLRHANIATTDIYTDMLTEILSENPPDHITSFLKAINPRHPDNADKI